MGTFTKHWAQFGISAHAASLSKAPHRCAQVSTSNWRSLRPASGPTLWAQSSTSKAGLFAPRKMERGRDSQLRASCRSLSRGALLADRRIPRYGSPRRTWHLSRIIASLGCGITVPDSVYARFPQRSPQYSAACPTLPRGPAPAKRRIFAAAQPSDFQASGRPGG